MFDEELDEDAAEPGIWEGCGAYRVRKRTLCDAYFCILYLYSMHIYIYMDLCITKCAT